MCIGNYSLFIIHHSLFIGAVTDAFLVALLQCTDTVFAVARPETADETVTSGTDESVPYERPLAAADS